MSIDAVITNKTTNAELESLEHLLLSTSNPISNASFALYGQHKIWDELIAAIAAVPRKQISIAVFRKDGEMRKLSDITSEISSTRLSISGAILDVNALKFKTPPEHLELRNCLGDVEVGKETANALRSFVVSAPVGLRVSLPTNELIQLETLYCDGHDDGRTIAPIPSVEQLCCTIETEDGVARLFAAMQKMPKLHLLKIAFPWRLTGKVFEALRDAKLDKLRTLTLAGRKESETDYEFAVDWFPPLQNLQILQMCKFRLAEDPGKLFAPLRTVKTILLRNTKMVGKSGEKFDLEVFERAKEDTWLDEKKISERLRKERAALAKMHNVPMGEVFLRVLRDSAGD